MFLGWRHNRLSLDTDIRPYLKTWKLPENEFSKGRKITLLNLLSHTAGLNNEGFGTYLYNDSIPNINQQLNGLPPAKNKPVAFVSKPGEKYSYSNPGAVVVQKILEDNISPDYIKLINTLVLQPLGLSSSSLHDRLPSGLQANAATAYASVELAGKYPVTPYLAAGSLWSTPSDIARFVIAVQNMYNGKKQKYLPQPLAKQMLTPTIDTAFYQLSYTKAKLSPGFFIMKKDEQTYFFHSGGSEGFSSIYYGCLTNGKGAVVMVNSNNTQILFEIINSIVNVYNWKDFYNPQLKPVVQVKDSLLKLYEGEYLFKDIDVAFRVIKLADGLYLSSKEGNNLYTDISEKMYASAQDKFFLLSNKLEFKFLFSENNKHAGTMYIKSGDDILKGTRK